MSKIFVFLIGFGFLNFAAYAGGNHFHPKKVAVCAKTECSADEIKKSIKKGILALNKWAKIDRKWIGSKAVDAELKTFEKKGKSITVWVVEISQRVSKDKEENHFVFYTKKGKVFRANGSGVLK
jgi:hypothetical protein